MFFKASVQAGRLNISLMTQLISHQDPGGLTIMEHNEQSRDREAARTVWPD